MRQGTGGRRSECPPLPIPLVRPHWMMVDAALAADGLDVRSAEGLTVRRDSFAKLPRCDISEFRPLRMTAIHSPGSNLSF